MNFDVEPMNVSPSFDYSSWKLLHQTISQLVLNGFEAVTMRQISVFIAVETMIVELFAVNLAPVCKKLLN